MKRPLSPAGQIQNEMLAMRMIQEAPAEWLEFFHRVQEYLRLDARAKAGSGKVPRDNKARYDSLADLSYVVNTLDEAERDLKAPPIAFDFSREGGGQ